MIEVIHRQVIGEDFIHIFNKIREYTEFLFI